MAVGVIKAIEGGGTAMGNFAGGVAKGYAKGLAFSGLMLGLTHLQNGVNKATSSPDNAKAVEAEPGSDSSDGHKGNAKGNSNDLGGEQPYKVTAVTQGKTLAELQEGQQYVSTLFGNDEYNTNSVVKAENDFLEAIRKHPQTNELTPSELDYLQIRQEYLNSQVVVAQYSYNAVKYGSLITGFTLYEFLSRGELGYSFYQDGVTAKNVTGAVLEVKSSIISSGAKHPVINAIGAGVSEAINRLPWEKQNDK